MNPKLKSILKFLAYSVASVSILIASAGGWFYWRYLTASRNSIIEAPITLSPGNTYHVDLSPMRRLKRAKILIEFTLKDDYSRVNMSDKAINKIDYPDGRSIILDAQCIDSEGVKHSMYIQSYAPKRLFWTFVEALPDNLKFNSLEITASGLQTLSDIVWIDYQPM